MRLTLHTDFALRVLIQVGLNDGKLTTIKDIARTFDISNRLPSNVLQPSTILQPPVRLDSCHSSMLLVDLLESMCSFTACKTAMKLSET